eukprot:TRINITY_DN4946_c0_g2_i1.p1 TRINITY_DN4946_c0_g2~~TRINITY_DN4946_c0_g2_i1.p1  ORF type:complete len:738 (-),score=265.80 TRINITY_DN4946_c0_g2_i1:44-1927(-)
MIAAIQAFITETLGPEFIDPPAFDLAGSFRDSSVSTPLIFILSPGADPANDFLRFAEEMKFGRKNEFISLGQGQGPKAEKMITEAMERGTWVLLQNCHLAESWMSTLEKIVDSILPEKVHRDFRLWLTSMPSEKFPVSVLQVGIKMTNEPPKGIKANLMRTYKSFDDAFFQISQKSDEWRKLLFGLAFFHAIVQERRKFGALGWNIPYEYNSSDLMISIRQLKMFLEEYQQVPYKLLQFLVGEINYGGRVTDDLDRRTLKSILMDYYSPSILANEYKFSGSGIYHQISDESLKAYLKYIRQLPINDHPEVFGLHENADMSSAEQETFNMFDTIVTLQPRVSSGKAQSRDMQISEVVNDILKKIVPFIDVKGKLGENSFSDSMTTVLTQEIVRYNRLLLVINSTLKELLKALRGLVVMSFDLEKLANSLFNNQIPDLWMQKSYPSLKPLSAWVTDLKLRLDFITSWLNVGGPAVYWISGFFFPQAFLTGVLQTFARKNRIPVDTVSFDFQVIDSDPDQIEEGPEDGVYIRGLFLEGAKWDPIKHQLGECKLKELFSEMPIVWLKPIANRKKPSRGFYDAPVYKTLTRAGTLSTTGHSTNYVLSIELPTDEEPSHWIKRGCALICSLNY